MKQLIWIAVFCLLVPSSRASEVAILIDDMGNMRRDAKAFALPSEVAFSILPHTPFSQSFAKQAAAQSREVMLHMPMESLSGKALGEGGLTSDMYPERIAKVLSEAFESVPNAIGLNNHMGSKLTQLTLPMKTTMSVLKEKGVFFIDSRTTRYSRAEEIAKTQGVTTLRRNIFLDHGKGEAQIKQQFRRLIQHAKHYGQALAIGHPHPVTIRFLRNHLAMLEKHDVKLVSLSALLPSASTDEAIKAMQGE